MGKKKTVELSQEQRAELEKGYRMGKSHAFRTRCQMILLKSENRTSIEVAGILGGCEVVVNNWLKRFEAEGIMGLQTRAGRGRPPILSQQNPQHLEKVRAEIKKHPNSVKTVVGKLEEDLNLQMHPETLKRFLKKMVTDSVALERGSKTGRWVLKEPLKKNS
jgi:transposase